MLRGIGAACIVAASALLGERAAQKKKRDLATVEALLVGLSVLEAEISYLASDLEEAFLRAAHASPEAAGLFQLAAQGLQRGERASETWRKACRGWRAAKRLPLRLGEILSRLSAAWGPWRAEDHVRHIRLARDLLKEEQQAMRSRIDDACRLRRYLGVSSGLILVLLLY